MRIIYFTPRSYMVYGILLLVWLFPSSRVYSIHLPENVKSIKFDRLPTTTILGGNRILKSSDCPTDVVLIAGQSNAVGHGVPPSNSEYKSGMRIVSGEVLSDTQLINNDPIKVSGYKEKIQTFGVENYIADCIPSKNPIVIKSATGGSAIRGYIKNPRAGRLKWLEEQLVSWRRVNKQCNANYHLLWIHGGADANEKHVGLYQEKERRVFDSILQIVPDAKIYNVLLQRKRKFRGWINTAKVKNGSYYGDNYYVLNNFGKINVDNDVGVGYETHSDNIHLNNIGLKEMAHEFCSKF